jgi:repressor of RNA polymerase III transcription MAF1
MGDSYRSLSPQLWSSIDEEINIKESEIFSYRPDGTSDPFSESGIIWSFNFFFHNRKLRRILFLTCRAGCKTSTSDDENEEDIPLQFTGYPTFDE